jgi:hypothetical protein
MTTARVNAVHQAREAKPLSDGRCRYTGQEFVRMGKKSRCCQSDAEELTVNTFIGGSFDPPTQVQEPKKASTPHSEQQRECDTVETETRNIRWESGDFNRAASGLA